MAAGISIFGGRVGMGDAVDAAQSAGLLPVETRRTTDAEDIFGGNVDTTSDISPARSMERSIGPVNFSQQEGESIFGSSVSELAGLGLGVDPSRTPMMARVVPTQAAAGLGAELMFEQQYPGGPGRLAQASAGLGRYYLQRTPTMLHGMGSYFLPQTSTMLHGLGYDAHPSPDQANADIATAMQMIGMDPTDAVQQKTFIMAWSRWAEAQGKAKPDEVRGHPSGAGDPWMWFDYLKYASAIKGGLAKNPADPGGGGGAGGDNTMLYVAIGVGVLAIGGAIFWKMKKKAA